MISFNIFFIFFESFSYHVKIFFMKKLTVFAIIFLFTVLCFGYERDYTNIQKKQMKQTGEEFIFRDVFGKEFKTKINSQIKKNPYKKECFKYNDKKVTYSGDKRFYSKMGVDISRHDGNVDFAKLKKDGIDFVILRAGYRGYQSGKLNKDENFDQNIKKAVDAGLEVGIYVFSQAKDSKEALEEAELAINAIKNYKITLPVFYDPEIIRNDKARSDSISGEQFTQNAITFCEKIKQAGYVPGVYSNMLWEAYELDLTKFSDYVIWYADYEDVPQTPYDFTFWQYAEKDGDKKALYDMDVILIPGENQ